METNEVKIAREEIIEQANQLIRLCQKHGMAIAGFVWGTNVPMVFSFGNTSEQRNMPALEKLYLELCNLAEDSIIDGHVEMRHADRTQ